jgi:hypothetical protein
VSRFISLRALSILFIAGYCAAVIGNWPLFRYYPLVGQFSLIDIPDKSLGPAMTWYGWMATAAIPALIAAAVFKLTVPDRWRERFVPLLWLAPLAVLVAGYIREQEWLLN